MSLAFTLSISRSGDTDYLNDRNALTGAGILLAITGGGALFALGRGVLSDFRRRRVYLGEGPPAVDEVVADAETASPELAGVPAGTCLFWSDGCCLSIIDADLARSAREVKILAVRGRLYFVAVFQRKGA